MPGYEVVQEPDATTWDAFVSREGSVLQSSGFGRLKAVLGWEPEHILVLQDGQPRLGALILYRRLAFGPMGLVSRGPVGEDDAALPALLDAIRDSATRRGAAFVKFEVTARWETPLRHAGAVPAALAIQPRTTMIADLTGTDDTLLARMNQNARRNIRKQEANGVRLRTGTVDDTATFYALSEETGERDGFALYPERYYRAAMTELAPNVALYLAEVDDTPVAAIMVARSAGQSIYLYGASSNEYRDRQPNHPLQWYAMQQERALGSTSYDLWGVPDALGTDPEATGTGGLWGVVQFKRSLGGVLLQHPEPLDLVTSPWRYRAWQAAFAIARRIRPRRGNTGAA